MKKSIEYATAFAVGAVIYSMIEILWRGHTHWTMGVAGGICLAVIYYLYDKCPSVPLAFRCVTGTAVILAVEFATGFIVNIVLGWNVWDYSDKPLNLYGQICPLYAFYWFLLCIPGNWISGSIRKITRKYYTE